MKKLLIIPMLFACLLGMGQAAGGSKHFIGEKFSGGIVFNVSSDGLHGLIAETQDQCNKCNTSDQKKILNSDNHSAAGKSFKDWRIPDIEELKLLYLQRSVVGGFSDFYYFSSTKSMLAAGYFVYYRLSFKNGDEDNSKMSIANIRTIRSF